MPESSTSAIESVVPNLIPTKLKSRTLTLLSETKSRHAATAAPQSEGQLEVVSPDSHVPLPQTDATGQSTGQLPDVSPDSQIAFPQIGSEGEPLATSDWISETVNALFQIATSSIVPLKNWPLVFLPI